ncbi:MAG: class I SAM-dependent methyltransferase [Pseudomonadota bacterium]
MRYTLPRIWTQETSREFGIYWSDALMYGTLQPVPEADELLKFYDSDRYSDYLSGVGKTKSTPRKEGLVDKIITKLAWQLDKGDPEAAEYLVQNVDISGHICDIGCGDGQLLKTLQPHCRSATGIDPSKVSIQALAEKELDGFLGTAEVLPVEVLERRFDVITMQQSLEHCSDPVLAMQNIRGICATNGRLLVEVPNHECFGFAKYGPAWFHTDAGRHIHFFTARSLGELAASTGWQALHFGYFSYTRQFSASWISSMQEVWDRLYDTPSIPGARRAKQSDRLTDLMSTAFAQRGLQYDVVRMVCAPA